jgi:hypothetical protein
MGTACQAVLLVGLVELLYYGMLPNGLPLMMVAAGMGLRKDASRPPAGAPAPSEPERAA